MTTEEPPIRQAIYYTQATLVARAALYRNLVVIVSVGACGLVLLSIVYWNLKFLLGVCWILPLVSGWLWLDARRVWKWSNRILEICQFGNLDVEVFRSTICQLRYLPQNSLAGMLDTLPLGGSANQEKKVESIRKQDQAAVAERTYLVNAISSGVGCVLVIVGLLSNIWLLLLGLAICFTSSRISRWIADKSVH